MLATAEEEDQRVQCIDDITGTGLPWLAVRQPRAQKSKCVRDLGVFEKLGERGAIAGYQGHSS